MKNQILTISILIISIIVIITDGCKKDEENVNNPPEIQSITSTPNTSSTNRVPAGDQVSLTVTATDPAKNNLTYAWEADGGNFIGDTDKSSVTWESPVTTNDTTYKISAIVGDGVLTSTKDITIYVGGVTLCNLKGYVYYAGTTIPVSDVLVTVKTKSSVSGEDGYFEINDIPSGNQTLEASKEGFDDLSTNVELNSDINELNVEMTSASFTHSVSGTITSKSNGSGILDCRVSMLNPDGSESQLFTYTTSNGDYQLATVPDGNRTLRLSEKCHFETQLIIADSDYQFDAEFETTMTDNRDGKVYDVVEIGGVVWMAENINYGERIDGIHNQEDNQITEKYCYDNDESNCDTYGGLYQWNEMMQYNTTEGIQGICPDGWHLATDDEWTVLVNYLGGADIAGAKLKEKGTDHWIGNVGATDESGFSALPSGCRLSLDYTFQSLHIYVSYWSSTVGHVSTAAWYRYMEYNHTTVHHYSRGMAMGRSVRCIKDE